MHPVCLSLLNKSILSLIEIVIIQKTERIVQMNSYNFLVWEMQRNGKTYFNTEACKFHEFVFALIRY